MAQVLEMVRTLQDNAAASKAEQERMQTELAASQSRNDKLCLLYTSDAADE